MKKFKFGNILWGLLFLAAAGLIVLHLFGLLGGINTWTLLISIPIVIGIVASLVNTEWGGVFFLSALLAFIYRGNIESALDIRINVWALLGIATLLTAGFYILFGKRKKNRFFYRVGRDDEPYNTENVTGEKLYFEEQFSGSSKYISSDNLSYVSIQNQFGGMEVYFDRATLAPEGAVVDVKNAFGGVELHIPRGWNVDNQMSNFAAGIDNPDVRWVDGAPTITIRGSNRFGGIEINRV
ncbi:MAG: cell wall-active antibiotics response protein [Oscillospiraceae bacterium]|nr:cell wall-active antibiotics response protein [Oscillospiraceae bacterium]